MPWSTYQTETVTWTKLTEGNYGAISEATETLDVRYEQKIKTIRDQNGNEVTAQGFVVVPTDKEPGPKDRYTIGAKEYAVGMVEALKDFQVRSFKVWLV